MPAAANQEVLTELAALHQELGDLRHSLSSPSRPSEQKPEPKRQAGQEAAPTAAEPAAASSGAARDSRPAASRQAQPGGNGRVSFGGRTFSRKQWAWLRGLKLGHVRRPIIVSVLRESFERVPLQDFEAKMRARQERFGSLWNDWENRRQGGRPISVPKHEREDWETYLMPWERAWFLGGPEPEAAQRVAPVCGLPEKGDGGAARPAEAEGGPAEGAAPVKGGALAGSVAVEGDGGGAPVPVVEWLRVLGASNPEMVGAVVAAVQLKYGPADVPAEYGATADRVLAAGGIAESLDPPGVNPKLRAAVWIEWYHLLMMGDPDWGEKLLAALAGAYLQKRLPAWWSGLIRIAAAREA